MKTLKSLRTVPHLDVWAAVLIMSSGAVLLFVAWAKTASRTDVAFQIPYVISCGFTGLGLIVVGLTVLNLSVKRAQTRERSRQSAQLHELVAELRRAIDAPTGSK